MLEESLIASKVNEFKENNGEDAKKQKHMSEENGSRIVKRKHLRGWQGK